MLGFGVNQKKKKKCNGVTLIVQQYGLPKILRILKRVDAVPRDL